MRILELSVFGWIIFRNYDLPVLADLGPHLLPETCHAV